MSITVDSVLITPSLLTSRTEIVGIDPPGADAPPAP
jgi:hypothetical protein